MEKKTDKPTTVGKIKVSDLAKELGLSSKDLLQTLKDLGVSAKTAASSIDAESAQVVREINAPAKEKEKEREEEKEGKEKEAVKEEAPPQEAVIKVEKKVEPKIDGPIIDTPEISVKDLSDKIAVRASELIKELM